METYEIRIFMHEILRMQIGGKQRHETVHQADGQEAMYNDRVQLVTISRQEEVESGKISTLRDDGYQINERHGVLL